jgi:hypothetical protein
MLILGVFALGGSMRARRAVAARAKITRDLAEQVSSTA